MSLLLSSGVTLHTSITDKSNSLLLIRYPFLTVMTIAPLQLLAAAILNFT